MSLQFHFSALQIGCIGRFTHRSHNRTQVVCTVYTVKSFLSFSGSVMVYIVNKMVA